MRAAPVEVTVPTPRAPIAGAGTYSRTTRWPAPAHPCRLASEQSAGAGFIRERYAIRDGCGEGVGGSKDWGRSMGTEERENGVVHLPLRIAAAAVYNSALDTLRLTKSDSVRSNATMPRARAL